MNDPKSFSFRQQELTPDFDATAKWRHYRSRVAVQVMFVALLTLPAAAGELGGVKLVDISGTVRGGTGKHAIFVALWNCKGFLIKPVKQLRIDPQAAPVFHFHVPTGRWAISAFEDENDNNVLDMGRFGPREPNGFWRAFHGWHKPRFADIVMSVDRSVDDANIAL